MAHILFSFCSFVPAVHSFSRVDRYLNRADASNWCRANCDSDLASIHLLADYDAILALGTNQHREWIGLANWNGDNVNWQWDDGTPFDYASSSSPANPWCGPSDPAVSGFNYPWGCGQPDNVDQECVVIGNNPRHWMDWDCFQQENFICNCGCAYVHLSAYISDKITDWANVLFGCQW